MGWKCLRIVQWKFQNTRELKCDFVSGEPIQRAEPGDNGVFPLQISSAVNAELGYLFIRMLPYSPLLLIRWSSSQVQFFLSCNEPIWLPLHSTKLKQWRLPRIKGYILKYRVPPLWPTYIGEKENNICQSIWGKSEVLWRTYWGIYWEPDGNLLQTQKEHGANTLGTRESWKQILPATKLKRKKSTFSACLGLLIGSMKFLFPKEFVTIFGLG